MENTTKNRATAATLTDAELAALVNLAGITPGKDSPLPAVSGKTRAADAKVNIRLQQLGFLASSNPARLTPECTRAINTLAAPEVTMQLVWGDAAKVNISTVYADSHNGSEAMVAFNRAADDCNSLSFFVSHEEITGLVRDRLAFSRVDNPPAFSLQAEASALPVFFSLLDLYCENKLQALIDRAPVSAADFSKEAIKKNLVNAKTATTLDWYSSLGYLMFPRELPGDTAIAAGMKALEKERALVINRDSVSLPDSLLALASQAFPILTYFGATIAGRPVSAQFGLVRSPAALLLVQSSSNSGGAYFTAESIGTSNVPELLFNLFTMPFAAPAPSRPAAAPAANACPKCATKNPAGAIFCSRCGADLTPGPKVNYCPKCGDAVRPGEKFCDKCGARID